MRLQALNLPVRLTAAHAFYQVTAQSGSLGST